MKRFELIYWADDAIGHGYELYYYGQYVGCSLSVELLRRWARNCWKKL